MKLQSEWNLKNRLEVWELRKRGNMVALPEKKRKKLNKFIVNSNERFNVLFLELTIQWFVILCLDMAWDNICNAFLIYHNPGIGPMQWVIAVFCVYQIWRYARLIKR